MTVTRNGMATLPRHLESLLDQKSHLAEVIVVDNASTDGTLEFLSESYPAVKVIQLGRNEGVSGGYCAGLEYAISRNYDWAWILDQDSKPLPETLTRLMTEYQLFRDREKLGLIAPLPVDEVSGEPYALFLWKERQLKVSPALLGNGLTLVDMVISSGSLIRVDAVKKAGLPRRDFFMDFVDYEHCLRLRRSGFLIGVAKECTMPHTIGQPRTVTLLGRRRNWTTHPPWRDYYKARNRAFVVWHQLPCLRLKAFVIRQFLKQMIGSLLYDPEKVRRIRFMWMGLWDGIRGRLGITVRPNG